MRYITGIHALNLTCDLDTCGDWHTSALKWEGITYRESKGSKLGDWGIESNRTIPNHDGVFYVANHIRALLDLLIEGNFGVAQGMREDFICNEEYTPLILEMVWSFRELPHWSEIDKFMLKEYKLTWFQYKEDKVSE